MGRIIDMIFNSYLDEVKSVLRNQLEDQAIKNLTASIQRDFRQLLNSPQTKEIMPKDINHQHHVAPPLFVISLYRGLKLETSLDVPIELMINLAELIFRDALGSHIENERNNIERSDDKWKKFTTNTIRNASVLEEFDPKLGTKSDDYLEIHLGNCFYYDVLKAHDEVELGKVLCTFDGFSGESVDDWVEFSRPQTIADGAEYCRFCYKKIK